MRDLRDGEALLLGSSTYRVTLPEIPSSTWDRVSEVGPTLSQVALHFRVSLDEEHVELAASIGGRRADLGSRAHHYLLLTLARLRVLDVDPALPSSARGWVSQDRLLKMLGARSGALHLSVFRARSELAQLGVIDSANLIERRKSSQQLRLGVSAVSIERI